MRFSGKCFLDNNENKGIPSQKNFPFTEELYKKYLNDPDNHDGVNNSPRARHPGVGNKVGLSKHLYKQS